MSFIGNVIWLIFGGFLAGIGYMIGGLIISITIVGIPFGVQAFKLGAATMAPFGKEFPQNPSANKTITVILNIIWALLFGWEIAVAHLLSGLLLFITIIGIPFAKQHFKLIPMALLPFGRDIQ